MNLSKMVKKEMYIFSITDRRKMLYKIVHAKWSFVINHMIEMEYLFITYMHHYYWLTLEKSWTTNP